MNNLKESNKFNSRAPQNGFTLIEIIIVCILLGIICSLTVSTYRKLAEQSYCRNAQMNLSLIHHAAKVYYIKNGDYGGPSVTGLATINTRLRINIPIPDNPKFVYQWQTSVGPPYLTYSAIATRSGGPAYSCTIANLSNGTPTCSVGEDICPSIRQ